LKAIYVRDANAPESAEPELIRARRGVILGSGGFEHNEQMRVKYQRAPIITEWTVGAKANTGDGIIAGEKLGAALDIMEDAWWDRRCRWSAHRGSRCPSATRPARSS
jgi:3-oxosteroid 1-dehydrogenase